MSNKSNGDYGDYDDHSDSGYKSQKSSYRSDSSYGSSSSGSRENFGKTSSFNTMLSDEGKFLGVNLDPETRKKIGDLYPLILPTIVQKGEEIVSKWNPKFGNAVGWALALGNQALQVGDNIYKSVQSSNDLRVAVQPLNKVSGASTSALSGNNEVIANARGRISSIFWQRNVDTLVSTIGALPAIIQKVSQHGKISANKNLQKELEEAAGDVNKIKALQEKRLSGTLTKGDSKGISPKDVRAANALIVAEHELEYIANFKKFKAERQGAVVKEIEEALLLTTENVEYKIKDLEKFGIPTEPLKKNLRGVERRDTNGHYYLDAPDEAKQKEIIDKFIATTKGTSSKTGKGSKTATSSSLDRYADEALKYEYAKKNGAWDHEWRPASERRSGERDEPTLKQQLEADFKKLDEESRKLENEALSAEKRTKSGLDEHGDSKNIQNLAYGVAGGVAKQVVGGLLGDDAKEKYKKPIALDRILHLRRVVEQPKDNPNWKPPEEVPPVTVDSGKKGGESKEKSMSYTQFVHEIFQQHQRDSKRVDIGDRYYANLEKERWDDKKIQEIPDDQLTSYEYAVKTIAKRIKDGRMDALTLIELVGDPKGKKIVQNDGRTFGPQGAGKDENDIKVAILTLIEEKSAQIHTAQVKTEEQVNDKLANFVFSVDDMKKALETDVLDVEQRAFVFTMFSDVVGSDVKLCQKLGINTERCQQLRKESQEHINQTLDSVVAVLSDMIEKNPEEVEKSLKITDKEKSLIKSLAKKEVAEGKHAVDLTKDREEVEVLKTISANAAMLLGKDVTAQAETGDQPVSFWQRVKNKIEDLKKPKEVASKESSSHESSSKDTKTKASSLKDDFADDSHKDERKSSYKSHDPYEHDGFDEKPSSSHMDKFAKHRGHDDFDLHEGSEKSDYKHTERFDRMHADKPEKHTDRVESKRSDKGDHDRKWASERRGGNEGYTGRVRSSRMENESESSIRGGLT